MKFINFEELALNLNRDPARFTKKFSSYTLAPDTINAGAQGSDVFRVDEASMFVWTKTTYIVDLAGAAQTEATRVVPLLTLQLKDTGSSMELFDVAQPLANIAGTGQIPFLLPAAYLFQPQSTMNGLFTNYSAAENYANITVSLLGYRVYDLEPNKPKIDLYAEDLTAGVM